MPKVDYGPDGLGGRDYQFEGYTQLLKHSWLFNGVNEEIVKRLLSNEYFMRNGGILSSFGLLSKPEWKGSETLKSHVLSNLAIRDEIIRMRAWLGYRKDLILSPDLSHLFPEDREGGAKIQFYSELLNDQLSCRGQGITIEELTHHFIRPASWGLREQMSPTLVRWYVKHRGTEYTLSSLPITEVQWGLALARPPFDGFSDQEINPIIRQIEQGQQPYIEIKYDNRLYYGEDLTKLPPEEIDTLAQYGAYCHPECQFYHGFVGELKTLGELIAPVDAEVFGEALYERYKDWKQHAEDSEKFHVLIPAQADETTVSGLLKYLEKYGINKDEIINNFHIDLSDLCVTPLLRVYAELKRRELLEVTQITSTDVFKWQEHPEQFDFICADHFIDLFPSDGMYNQKNLLTSLITSLAPEGQLILTARYESKTEDVMEDFYSKVDSHILYLLSRLEERKKADVVYGGKIHGVGSTAPYTDTQKIIALLIYRQLREVYPFETEKDLVGLLDEVSNCSEKVIDCQIERLEEGKVKIVITRKSE